jgi:phosphoribosylformylglycinamidine (FGAM) synthase-like amidotransferase family enzyme
LGWDLQQYADRGGLVIGICNGFQALIRMGIFGKDLSITQNKSGQFLNTWIKVSPRGNRCLWLKGIGTIDLPVRHGEGRIVFDITHKQEVLRRLDRYSSICLKYEMNPNGSDEDVAGLSDSTGRILGLMPHPEGFVRWTQHPEWTMQPGRSGAPGQGLALFENAFHEAKESQM